MVYYEFINTYSGLANAAEKLYKKLYSEDDTRDSSTKAVRMHHEIFSEPNMKTSTMGQTMYSCMSTDRYQVWDKHWKQENKLV